MERSDGCFEDNKDKDKEMEEEHTICSLVYNTKIKHNVSKSVQLTVTSSATTHIHHVSRKSKSEVHLSKYNLNTLNNIIEHPEHSQSNNTNNNNNDNEASKEQQRILDKQLVNYALQRGIFSFQEDPIPLTTTTTNNEPPFPQHNEPPPYTTSFTQSYTTLLPENYTPQNLLKLSAPIYYDTISYSILKDKLNTILLPSILKNINKHNLNKALSQSEELLFYLTQIIPIETNNK
jgi:hypothetical protein